MTLLKLFNKVLKELPSISENLENSIMVQGWSEEKSQQAVKIVQQIKKLGYVEGGFNSLEGYNYVRLDELTISFSPKECGINKDTTFEPENICQADKYIKDLLNDINHISEDVQFSLDGREYKNEECTFFILWEF